MRFSRIPAWMALALLLNAFATRLHAQTERSVYGEIGLGGGQTLFFGDIRDQLRSALGSDFDPGIVGNVSLGVIYAPARWKGFGIGGRIKGSGSGPQSDDGSGSDYFFNYYTLGGQVRWHFLSREFNRGLYARAGVGFGQLTTKRQFNDANNTYVHQFAIGTTLHGGLGYAFPVGRNALGVEAEFEYSSRNGTISGRADSQTFTSGQVGLQVVYMF